MFCETQEINVVLPSLQVWSSVYFIIVKSWSFGKFKDKLLTSFSWCITTGHFLLVKKCDVLLHRRPKFRSMLHTSSLQARFSTELFIFLSWIMHEMSGNMSANVFQSIARKNNRCNYIFSNDIRPFMAHVASYWS